MYQSQHSTAAIWLTALLLTITVGCAGSIARITNRSESETNPDIASADQNGTEATTQADTSSISSDDATELVELIQEIQAMPGGNDQVKSELIDQLKQSEPQYRSQLVASIQAQLTFYQRVRESDEPAATHTAAKTTLTPESPVPATSDIAAPALPVATADLISEQPTPTSPASTTTVIPATASSPQFQLTTQQSPQPSSAATQLTISIGPPIPSPAKDTAGTPTGDETASSNNAASIDKDEKKKPEVPSSVRNDWRYHLDATIQALEYQTSQTPKNADEVSEHASLRMLYLANNQRDEAMKPIPGISAAQQDFWSQQMYGISALLDSKTIANPSRRASEAALHLGRAIARLKEMSSLEVKNLAFCTEVSSFGVHKTFPDYSFRPGDEVLLYAEMDNYRSESTEKGYHTAFGGSYQILDSRGNRVSDQDLPEIHDYCGNPRRDFFIRYRLFIPERINPGDYTLQLTIEDNVSRKITQSSIDFSVIAR